MSDLLTRLAERALGRAAPALEPRLPSRWADAPAQGDAPAFSELSIETEAPLPPRPVPRARGSAAPDDFPLIRRPAAAPAPTAPHHPPPEPARAAAEPHPSAQPSSPAPPAPVMRVEAVVEDRPRPAPEPRDQHPRGEPVSVRPATTREQDDAGAGDGFRVVERVVERGPSPAPLRTTAARHDGDELRDDSSSARREMDREPSPPSPPADPDGGVVREIVREIHAARREDAAPSTEVKAKDAGEGLREVITRIERGASSAAVAGAPSVASREAEAREDGEERPVIRVTIGRIEVRAAPQTAAPPPAARKGWKPPVMGLDAFLKREGGR